MSLDAARTLMKTRRCRAVSLNFNQQSQMHQRLQVVRLQIQHFSVIRGSGRPVSSRVAQDTEKVIRFRFGTMLPQIAFATFGRFTQLPGISKAAGG
jgi:hypothetical protein